MQAQFRRTSPGVTVSEPTSSCGTVTVTEDDGTDENGDDDSEVPTIPGDPDDVVDGLSDRAKGAIVLSLLLVGLYVITRD